MSESSNFNDKILRLLMTESDHQRAIDYGSLPRGELDFLLVSKPSDVTAAVDSNVPLIGIFTGIDLDPIRGIKNRVHMDGVVYTSQPQYELAQDTVPNQKMTWFQPTYHVGLKRSYPGSFRTINEFKAVEFYTQERTPNTVLGRQYILDLLNLMHSRFPHLRIFIKERLPRGSNGYHENVGNYSDLSSTFGSNVEFSTEPLRSAKRSEEVLCLTCSSTAILTHLCAGGSVGALIDFPGALGDPLRRASRGYWYEAGLVVSARELLRGVVREPDKDWLNRNVRTETFADVLDGLLSEIV